VAADMRRMTGTAAAISTTDAGVLYERYSARILAYCLHALRDRGEAEDAVQTTFLQAHRALARGTTPEHEFAWLHTIAKNVCRVQKRTAARRAVVTGVDLDMFPAGGGEVGENERLRGLGDALASIPETQRRALLMREWHGLSSAEVASRMGMSAPATYALLKRARRSLADALTTVKGRSALGLNVWPLLLRLKGLFAGGTAKVATSAAAVVAVAASGVAIESAVVERSNRPTVVEQSAPSGATAMPVSALAVGTPDALTSVVRKADRFRQGAPTRAGDTEAARVPGVEPGATVALIPDLPRNQPEAQPPGTADAPEAPVVVVDDKTLESVLEPLPELPLPEVDLGIVTEVADDLVPDELPPVDETELPLPVEVPPLPPLPGLPPLP
jgi:RNA polymerase sigma factor (sigma-70 family)